MKTSFCKCGNRLFFNNHSCLVCGRAVGDCHVCRHLTSFSQEALAVPPSSNAKAKNAVNTLVTSDARWTCDQPACLREVVPCANRAKGACNSFVEIGDAELCNWCQFTTCIPDLSEPDNQRRWAALEAAKRRLLAALQQLDLPPYIDHLTDQYPLAFEFRAPVLVDGVLQTVSTGHAQGVITINAEEADSDRREAVRVALGEPQRTLVGHMRHEIGHYIDWSYAWQIARGEYIALFGDPHAVDYEQSKLRHYSQGAPTDWPLRHVSAYASMHPWEDFAETVNAYLDIVAIAETARDQKLAEIDTKPTAAMNQIVTKVLALAVTISEFNLDLGLQALLPEHLSDTAIDKLSFVHSLRSPGLREQYIKQLELATGSHAGVE